MIALSCSEARDLACNLLDGELSPELAQAVDEHLTGCPTCPALHSALLTVRGEHGMQARTAPCHHQFMTMAICAFTRISAGARRGRGKIEQRTLRSIKGIALATSA